MRKCWGFILQDTQFNATISVIYLLEMMESGLAFYFCRIHFGHQSRNTVLIRRLLRKINLQVLNPRLETYQGEYLE